MSVLPTRPTERPVWTENSPTLREVPSPEFRENGWSVNVRPPFEFMNWLFFNIGVEWLNYFDNSIDALAAGGVEFDATIGVGGTDNDINSFVARMKAINPAVEDLRVFIFQPQTLTTTQVIDIPGVEITMHPRAVIAKGGSLVTGIEIDAPRVKINGGRFLNFDEAGGSAVTLTANATNCSLTDGLFQNNSTDIIDLGQANITVNDQLI